MEAAVRAHPLWGGCSEEDLHSAGEVSHRYLHMSWDLGLNYLLLLFLSNLDIKPTFQNETSWLLTLRQYAAPADLSSITKVPSISKLENQGATMLLQEDQTRKVFRECPYMFVHFSDLKINDVEDLNNLNNLSSRLGSVSATIPSSSPPALAQEHVGTVRESEDNRVMELYIGLQKDTERGDDIPSSVSKQENTVSNFPREAVAPPGDNHDDTSEQ
ncbi:hypothetical protein CXB51_011272 [Gossypium anomalum]|uniref:Uncharacterized protein n=1 Tax=Gossypium anomalum TaxID=47600 RepID=A0A8J5YVQ1_9ROSI|nr:hypothetical protein CXB51_011272 [Gossypium anomalum]